MDVIEKMDEKKKALLKEMFRYLIAGGSAFVFDLITKTIFNAWLLPENMGEVLFFGFPLELRVTVATVAGFTVGLIVNYIISIFFVFTTEDQKKRGKGIKPFLIYLVVSIVGLGVNLGVTHLGNEVLSLTQEDTLLFMFVSCVAAGVALIWNYIGRKIFIYKGE